MTRNDINWPRGFDRTDPDDRTETTKFDADRRRTVEDILNELELLGVEHSRIETGAEHQKKNTNIPYKEAVADDPSAVVRWRMDDEDYAVACDEYADLRDNLRAIYLYVNEKRMMDNRPVETGQDEFATARLPPADDEGDAVAGEPPAHAVLGVEPDADPDTVRNAYREEVKDVHTDTEGGDKEAFRRLNEAKAEMVNDDK